MRSSVSYRIRRARLWRIRVMFFVVFLFARKRLTVSSLRPNEYPRVGSGQEGFKSRGSGRVRSRSFQTFVGQVGSGRDTSRFSRVGSGQATWPDPTGPVRFDLTREKPCKCLSPACLQGTWWPKRLSPASPQGTCGPNRLVPQVFRVHGGQTV